VYIECILNKLDSDDVRCSTVPTEKFVLSKQPTLTEHRTSRAVPFEETARKFEIQRTFGISISLDSSHDLVTILSVSFVSPKCVTNILFSPSMDLCLLQYFRIVHWFENKINEINIFPYNIILNLFNGFCESLF